MSDGGDGDGGGAAAHDWTPPPPPTTIPAQEIVVDMPNEIGSEQWEVSSAALEPPPTTPPPPRSPIAEHEQANERRRFSQRVRAIFGKPSPGND